MNWVDIVRHFQLITQLYGFVLDGFWLMRCRKMEGRNRKYEEELDDDNDENVEKVILLNWESLMCKAP